MLQRYFESSRQLAAPVAQLAVGAPEETHIQSRESARIVPTEGRFPSTFTSKLCKTRFGERGTFPAAGIGEMEEGTERFCFRRSRRFVQELFD